MAHHQINLAQTLHRLPERSCRETPAVAEAPFSVDDGNFDIPRQGIVLQAIIGDQNIAIRPLQQQTAGLDPPREHENWTLRPPGDQQRFIADLTRLARRPHCHRLGQLPAPITAADDTGTIAGLQKKRHQPNDQGRFPGAAHADIAYYDDGDRQMPGLFQPHPVGGLSQPNAGPKQGRQRHQ